MTIIYFNILKRHYKRKIADWIDWVTEGISWIVFPNANKKDCRLKGKEPGKIEKYFYKYYSRMLGKLGAKLIRWMV